MNHVFQLVLILWFCLASVACGKKTDAVIIVYGEDVKVLGTVKWTAAEGGRLRPNLWVPGNVVIFRKDGTVTGETGKAGRAYLINDKHKLEDIGAVDLKKTDEELAGQYGVKPKNS